MKKLKRIQKKYGNFIAQVISFFTMIFVVFENDDIRVVNKWLYDLFFNKPALKPCNYIINDTRIVTTRVVLEDFI